MIKVTIYKGEKKLEDNLLQRVYVTPIIYIEINFNSNEKLLVNKIKLVSKSKKFPFSFFKYYKNENELVYNKYINDNDTLTFPFKNKDRIYKVIINDKYHSNEILDDTIINQ